MPKSPQQVTELVSDDVRAARSRLLQISREQEFAERQLAKLLEQYNCDHDLPDREMANTREDRCRRCGYTWVR